MSNVNNTDPDQIALVQAAFDAPRMTHVTVSAGTPVQPEIRQDTPVADMGMGYREAGESDPR